ncbi:hypothetical protein DID88_003546 [Monilinia fructigena]|uniref:RanBD1 domain-containing protein n=1 Tax=Monilinia fructigena TaxID=38457 RepID=A0A395IEK2_9HELO|nr:hypothetical protein DID88_003546 [Monilinia fructigena]
MLLLEEVVVFLVKYICPYFVRLRGAIWNTHATPTFSPSFGSSIPNPFAQPAAATEEDPRADTTGEEAARRGKGFRAAGENEEAFIQPQSQFGATNTTQSNGGGLQFGSSMAQNQTGQNHSFDFNFSSSTPATQAVTNSSNSPFAFGSSSQAPVNNITQPFTFGGTNSGQEKNSLNFGTNSSSQAQIPLTTENQKDNSSTTFGQSNANNLFGQNNANNSFGAQNNPLGGSFGNQANTSFSAPNSTNLETPGSQSMFGSTTAATSAPSSSIFAPSFPATTSASSTSNLFGNAASSFPATSAPSTTNIFGSVNSSFPPAPASSTPLFRHKPADATSTASSTSLFGGKPADSTSSASSTPLFGSKPADSTSSASSTPLFGSKPADATSTASSTSLLCKPADATSTASSTSLFGGKPADSTSSASSTPLFGSKPADATSTVSSTSLFGGSKPTPSSGTANIFAQTSGAPASPFNFSKPAGSTPDLFNPNNQNNGQSNNLFGSKPAEEPKDKQTLDLFNANKSVGQQAFNPSATENNTEKTPAKTPSALFENFGKANPPGQSLSSPSNNQAESPFKIRGNAEATGYNKAPSFKPIDTPTDAVQPSSSNALVGFSSQTPDTQALNGPTSNGISSDSLALSAQLSGPVTRATTSGRSTNLEFRISEPTITEMDANMPQSIDPKRKNEFYALFRITSVQRAISAYFHHLPPGADPSKGLAWMEAKKKSILAEYKIDYISNKRGRAEIEFENDKNQENLSPQKRSRSDRSRSNRVQSPEKRSRATNESESQLNGNSAFKAPRSQSRRSTSPSKSSSRSVAPESNSNKKRKSDTQIETGDEDVGGNKKRRPGQSGHDEEVVSGGSSKKRKPDVYLTQLDPEGIEDSKNSSKRTVNGSSSSTSNMFKNILDSPEKPSRSATPGRKTRALPGAAKEASSVSIDAPLSNPFGTLPGASPIKSNTTATSTTPKKAPVFNLAPTSTTPTTSPAKPPSFTGVPTGGIKPPTFASAPTGGIKPPSFGSGSVNFMAQFGKQAADSAEENEKKLMQKAKDEDFDSEDDDEAEWEANYKKKRAAELKELAELAKGKAPSFLVKPTESSKSTEPEATAKSAATSIFAPVATTPSTSLFGQTKPATGAAENIFSSANVSRTSTPSLFSGTGSVLDGTASASGKTPSFAGNPFAHLSDADSNNQNDGDDESSDNGSDGEDEKKDPSYKPNTSNGTPSTPVDEADSEIASKKAVTEPPKLNLFGSISSSGATTPTPGNGGSLLSRMTREPVSEEKENSASKSTTNIFGSSFGAASGTSADKTWKPDTPIKFGSAPSSAPTFNITDASPSKPASNSLGGLFGNSGTSVPALSSGPTTTTGFQFGGPASAASSLFPSVAASADTSRATSPGATTDGATDADDNDPEKVHDQVNLLESNPGEENEDVVHSVRARALKFCPNEEGDKKASPWDTKGVGPLKVLRHKETKATRIVLRSDPSGSIILNKSLLSQVKYEASGKTIKLMTVGDDGKGLQTWVLQLKETGLAEELAKCLEENKINNS